MSMDITSEEFRTALREHLTSSPENIPPEEQWKMEVKQLFDIARNIGSYEWYYKGNFNDAHPGKHIGSTAQEIAKVDGLSSCVKPNKDGILTVDTNMLTLALLGYVSSLARIVLKVDKKETQ